VAEEVIRGQAEDALALHQAVAQQRLARGVHHHGDGNVDVEGVAVAVLAAQHVRARADLQEQALVARRHLHDGLRRGRVDLAHQELDAVALEHALRLGRGGRRIDRVLRHHVELAPHHAARRVDLLGGHLDAHHGVLAERAEKAGERREVPNLDRARLRAHDRRKAERERACGTGLQYASAYTSPVGHFPFHPLVIGASSAGVVTTRKTSPAVPVLVKLWRTPGGT
jgi:hypothetical protein